MKFGVTPEELFEKLSIKNKSMENFEFLNAQNNFKIDSSMLSQGLSDSYNNQGSQNLFD